MLTSKQRSNLMSQASKLPTLAQVGKNGLTDSVIAEIDTLLNHRELVKVGVLKNLGIAPKDLCIELAARLDADVVHVIGSKIILYRYSNEEGIEHIKL